MKKFIYICKAVLLYGTVFYSLTYLVMAESLTETKPLWAFIGLFIMLILIVICKLAFENEELDNFRPHWFD